METKTVSDFVVEIKKKIPDLLAYSLEQWREDMVLFIDSNWDCGFQDVEKLVDAVIDVCGSLHGQPLGYYCYTSVEMSKICAAVKGDVDTTDKIKKSEQLAYLIYQISYSDMIDAVLKSNSHLWDKLVRKVGFGVRNLKIAPNGYDDAINSWLEDKEIEINLTPFCSTVPRREKDLLHTPDLALSLSNLVYSEREQGVSLKRSLIGFLIRDMMDILTAVQWHFHELEIKADKSKITSMTDGKFNDFCRQQLICSVKSRDLWWWKN